MLADGMHVAYVGDPEEGLAVGDVGVIMLASKGASHVRVGSGTRQGDILLIDNIDLVTQASTDPISDNALFESSIVQLAVREIFERGGHQGLIAALHREGHLSSVQAVAEEALETVALWVRQDPSMREVLSQLDSDDGDALVSTIATSLMREVCE